MANINKGEAAEKLFQAWCMVGYMREAEGEKDNDALLHGTLAVAEELLGEVHTYLTRGDRSDA